MSNTRKVRKEIGEGRSKPIYIEPTVDDTAVLLCFFNPARFNRILNNALYIISVFKEYNIPYYVVECVFQDFEPQIPDANLVLRSNSYMFYKESLLNKLEKVVPEKYTKLVCIDADVIFDSPDWIDQISRTLNKYDIIQPFAEACWLTPDNTRINTHKMSYGYALGKGRPVNMSLMHMYHPGFAWAFKRDIFLKLGGFYERSIIGGGDIAFILPMFPKRLSDADFIKANLHGKFGEFVLDSWREYDDNFRKVKPSIGFLPIRLFHLFHGVQQDRKYTERYAAISKALHGSWEREISINNDGLYEFNNPQLNDVLYKYFADRNEDIPLEKAEQIVRQRRNQRPQQKWMSRRMRNRKMMQRIMENVSKNEASIIPINDAPASNS